MSAGTSHIVSATARLNAPPHRVYETIANYHTGHPRIVPKQFSDLTVERGGIGAGTVIRFNVTALGRTVRYKAEVSEPEPGRVLVETNVEGADSVTTFTVDPGTHPAESVVTISTELRGRPGIGGMIERWVTSRVLKPIYAEEMRLLEAVAAGPIETATTESSPA